MNSKIKIKIVKAAMRQGMLVLPHQAWGALWMPGLTLKLRLTLLALALVHWHDRWRRLFGVLMMAAAALIASCSAGGIGERAPAGPAPAVTLVAPSQPITTPAFAFAPPDEGAAPPALETPAPPDEGASAITPLAVAARAYLAPDGGSAQNVASRLAFANGQEHPSNMCGPLAAAVLRDAGILPANTELHDFWLFRPETYETVTDRYFPVDRFLRYRTKVPASNAVKEFPLQTGDFVYLYGGDRDTFEHMLVVTHADQQRAWGVTNLKTQQGWAIQEVLLYDAADDNAGQLVQWASGSLSEAGSTGGGGMMVFRLRPSAPPPTDIPDPNYVAPQDALDRFCRSYGLRRDGELAVLELKRFSFPADSAAAQSVAASCNYEERSGAPVQGVVIHATEGLSQNTLNYWAMPNTVSAHYLVTRAGDIIQVVVEAKAAWHAGPVHPKTCRFAPMCDGATSINDITIGIELENLGWITPVADRPGWYQNGYGHLTRDAYQAQIDGGVKYYQAYTPQQIAALEILVADIRKRNPTIEYVVGHKDVQAKTDPGPAFDPYWRLFEK